MEHRKNRDEHHDAQIPFASRKYRNVFLSKPPFQETKGKAREENVVATISALHEPQESSQNQHESLQLAMNRRTPERV